MNVNKNEAGILLPITVMEGVTVTVLPNPKHEYVMDSAQVALGYGVTKYNIRQHLLQHSDELIEGKHYVKGLSNNKTLFSPFFIPLDSIFSFQYFYAVIRYLS